MTELLMALIEKVLKDIKTSLEYTFWDMKICWILPNVPRNSTAVTALVFNILAMFRSQIKKNGFVHPIVGP